MSKFLFDKEVDQSLLKSGFTIPVNAQQSIQDAVGVQLSKGQKTGIRILLDGQLYDALLTNINLDEKYSSRVVLQIRYAEGSPICQRLKNLFSHLNFSVSNTKKEFIEVYSNDNKTLEIKLKSDLKESFFNYLGPADSLAGYQRSYKLVFYKCFFTRLLENQETFCETISSDFQQFYIRRKNAGLVPDIDVDDVIKNIENSTLAQVFNLIMRNPFNAISSHGFIVKEAGEKERFVLNPELRSQLSSVDIETIIHIVDQKLEKYFSNINKDTIRGKSMREFIEKIMNGYLPAKSEQFKDHPLGTYFRNDIPQIIYDTGIVDSDRYLVTGSVGKGNWADVPWIGIFLKEIAKSATQGVYIAYLLSKDSNKFYLTFIQGSTNKKPQALQDNARDIKGRIQDKGFSSDGNIELGDNLSKTAKGYIPATIYYKAYNRKSLPDEEEIRDDLKNMVDIYQEYYEKIYQQESPKKDGAETVSDVSSTIEAIKQYIASKGFSYQDGLIENFFLSLKSKPFVILAGTSGTGKTRLVKLFAEAVGANINNGRYKMVSVRPDWSDSTDLFGHVDLNGRFIPGAIIDFIKRAELDSTHPYFLCLDEMNLARVEYYLSDFLSVVETRDFQGGHITSEPLVSDKYYGSDSSAAGKYGTVLFPENLYVIGTVNMDETTFPFSRKVLDRANTIEFSFVDLTPPAEWAFNASAPLNLANEFLKTEYLLLAQCADQENAVNTYCVELQKINRILQQTNAHVGYRVRDEIVFYLLNNKNANLLPENEAMDNEIMQKILPRIQGSSASIKNMLCGLFRECAGEYEGQNTESDLSSKMMKVAQKSDCKYPKSAQKIAFMVRRFEEDGFTSYWL